MSPQESPLSKRNKQASTYYSCGIKVKACIELNSLDAGMQQYPQNQGNGAGPVILWGEALWLYLSILTSFSLYVEWNKVMFFLKQPEMA